MCGVSKEKKDKVGKEAGRSDTCCFGPLQSIANMKAVQDELNQEEFGYRGRKNEKEKKRRIWLLKAALTIFSYLILIKIDT
jgi:ribosomal protein L20